MVLAYVQLAEEVADGRADDGAPVRGPHHLVVAVHGVAAALVAAHADGGLLQANEALVTAAICDIKYSLNDYVMSLYCCFVQAAKCPALPGYLNCTLLYFKCREHSQLKGKSKT